MVNPVGWDPTETPPPRSPSVRRLKPVAWTVAALLAAEAALVSQTSGVAVALPPAAALPQTLAASKAKLGPAVAEDTASAQLMARMQDRRIEVLSERTETSTTYALPSGELQTSVYAAPIREKNGGKWQDVDTSLTDTGKALEPVVAVADIAVSDGGDTALASVATKNTSFAMGWEKKLPAPKVEGDTASYTLSDNETLTVTALSQGFTQNVVLDAALTGDTPEYRIPLVLDGLKLSLADSGRLLLKDAKGKLVAEAPAPMMWDSSVDKASGESKHQAPVKTRLETAEDGTQTLVLSPDAAYFERDLVYPVTIDPTTTLAASTDTWVATNYPDSQVSSTELKSGTYDAGTTKARSYLQFDVTPFKGKHITDTNLALYSDYSSTCATTGAGTQVRRITGSWSSSTVTWGAQPATTATGEVINKAALGYNSSCPAGTVNFDVDAIVQAWADGAANYGFRIAGASETDSYTWRRWRSANYVSGDGSSEPHLTVTYTSYPPVPTATAIAPSQANAYNGKRYVTSLNPTLSAKVTDPDGSATKAQFEVTPDPAYADTTYTYTGTSASVASGSTASHKVPTANAFPVGSHLRYRVRAHDGTDYGAWTGYSTFVLNTGLPAAPTISCGTYAQNGWTAKASSAVDCTLDTTSTDGAGYQWGLDNSSLPNKALDTTNGSGGDVQTVSIDPADGWHTLYARTIDSGGNLSTATTVYSFGVGADGSAILAPTDGADTARRLTLAASGRTTYTGATWQYRRGETDTWRNIPVSDVTAAGTAVTAWPVAVTGGTATQLVWNAVSTLAEDGTVQLRTVFTDGTTTGYTQTVEATLDRDAGNAPSAGVGPGSVNQLTGDYTLAATDASAFEASVGRAYSSRANSTDTEGQAAIYGPGWTSSIEAAASDYTQIRATSDTSVELLNADGTAIAFTAKAGGGWSPEPGAEQYTLTGTLTGTAFTLKDTGANTTVFTKLSGAATWTVSSSATAVDDTKVSIVSESVSSGGKTLARPKYVISPTGAVTSSACQTAPSTGGCRVLEFVYASSTTATSSVSGDFTGQVSAIRLWATSPGANAATAETIASYTYTSTGRLAAVWDPRISPALKTLYSYDGNGRVTGLTPPGELAWTFTYGKAGAAATAGEGMLLSASRPALQQGSNSVTGGTATTTVVYDVPLSGTAAPQQMTATTVAAWAQDTAPTDATAVFPPDSVPASSTGSALAATAYNRATVTYIDADGRETNTRNPGGALTTTEYDLHGNVTSQLTAANRALALGGSSDTLAELGLADLTAADRVPLLSTIAEYSADGERLLDEYGPLHKITLTKELKGSTAETTLPAGEVVPARQHSSYAYDEGRPADAAVSGLVTSRTSGATVDGYSADAETSTTTTAYDWATGQEKTTTGADPGRLLTTYDAQGRVATTRTHGSSGSDATTLNYTYYDAAATGTCASVAWDGLLCRTTPAAKISGGGANPDEAVTTVYTYNRWGQAATKVESANGVTRTTTATVDSAGRLTKTALTGGLGAATPASSTTYNAANGQPATLTSDGKTITYGYDALGRQTSYADGAGNTSTTEYDVLDRPVKSTDSAPSTVTYTYDAADNRKTVTDSVAGTFSGTYNADGTLLTETLPGNHTLTITTDPAGQQTGREYTTADGTTVVSDTVGYTVSGLQAGHTQTDGFTTQTAYTYDGTGRLTQASDATASNCTTRSYSFDASSNRKSLTTTSDDCDTGTSDATTAVSSYTYDSADRLVNPGYTYDAFGRTTTRGATSLTYYSNDLVASETVGAKRNTWTLDAAARLAVQTSQTQNAGGTWDTSATTTNHYSCSCDSPAWTETSAGTITRNVGDLTGGLAAATSATGDTVLQFSNIHGDVAVQLPLDQSSAPVVQRYDEFGRLLDGTVAATYGWLGSYQRSSDTSSGVILMGVRLYDPAAGRFLSVDPVLGGNDNSYDYCRGNPVSCLDLSGEYSYGSSYDLGYFWSSAKTVFKWMRNHFWVFPLTGCGSTLNNGERCNLAYGKGPVRVVDIYSTGWKFKSLSGHIEGKNKYIKFWLGKRNGRLQLNVKAWGPNNTWCNRNKPCAKANNVFAKLMWGLFASNIGWYAPRW
ncbi:DNRLRE domain-containing protein [Streptomyces sp. NPDC090109]|uniref:DNRLRE domain-containing protein n=1 Tax=Streptomyces sp. NPDC090109 TaxID=3365948 RepID=UPI0038176668